MFWNWTSGILAAQSQASGSSGISIGTATVLAAAVGGLVGGILLLISGYLSRKHERQARDEEFSRARTIIQEERAAHEDSQREVRRKDLLREAYYEWANCLRQVLGEVQDIYESVVASKLTADRFHAAERELDLRQREFLSAVTRLWMVETDEEKLNTIRKISDDLHDARVRKSSGGERASVEQYKEKLVAIEKLDERLDECLSELASTGHFV